MTSLIKGQDSRSASSMHCQEKKIIQRNQHTISRQLISEHAIKVLYRLHNAGYEAYIVGGGVRDLLLGREPKDFDVVTDAKPEQVKKLFRNCRLIGKRFRLAHVYFKGEIIEVATFRAAGQGEQIDGQSKHGVILRDNVYGTLDDDVWRRDFTVNAVYYNIADFSLVDYANGMQDLEQGIIRIIGDAKARYREDPVRILRAVRFAAKLGFIIHPDTQAPINEMSELLDHISNARLYDESLKLFLGGSSQQTFSLLRHYELLDYLFPMTEQILQDMQLHQLADSFLLRTFQNTDERLAQGKTVNPAFLFAALLWYPVQDLAQTYRGKQMRSWLAFDKAVADVLKLQCQHTAIPKRLLGMMREIWELQIFLERRDRRKIYRLLDNPRFRAAYDFLLLRGEVEPALAPAGQWWTDFLDGSESQRETLMAQLDTRKKR